jgi:putative copper resistance protein D
MFKLTLFLHIIAAMFWIGGMLFLTLVIAPFLISLKDPKKKSEIYQVVGKTFRFWGWVAIIILVITGPLNLYYMGVTFSDILDPVFHGTAYGKAVMTKITLVILIVISSFLHDFWIGPGARGSKKYSTIAKVVGRSNLLVALLIVLAAVFMRAAG